MAAAGEKAGKGTYFCKKCKKTVVLNDTADTLPPCPVCAYTEYVKW